MQTALAGYEGELVIAAIDEETLIELHKAAAMKTGTGKRVRVGDAANAREEDGGSGPVRAPHRRPRQEQGRKEARLDSAFIVHPDTNQVDGFLLAKAT